ncbi:MAG: YbaB/EbfC family nucleoid-associated protein [Peptoniphilaceae bacterium]|nr:YbaB/EbfC family nucleoid-associated protein [Peptoniphilaceae bacterium]MDD7383289.1 YbaB/EbfC family nucleoid-associated protein [Peptoniphilaceae bacterium]MDY3738340.1 YbaB/EbfC family nucleoid-associated protein [Peptoniphilaceae bacterium]
MGRNGFGARNNMGSMMKKVQKMQKQVEEMQSKIEETEFSSTSGGGAVEVKINGKKEILSVNIDKDAIDPEEKEMLEDMIVVAINDAMKKADQYSEEMMGKITNGINIPGFN